TTLEMSAIANDWNMAGRVLPKLLSVGKASWMIKTTRDNLLLLKAARERAAQTTGQLNEIISRFDARYQELCG
ncbi:MAG: hypothetical protein JO097_02455, partial [Acidobacteriaceae bacterium]|nr:hypothetical protein [Acidobacteriaceae bacterium]